MAFTKFETTSKSRMQAMKYTTKLTCFVFAIIVIGITYYFCTKHQKDKYPIIISGKYEIDINNIDIENLKDKRDNESLLKLYYYYKLAERDEIVANYWYEILLEESEFENK
jgi:hypothetical protein